MEKRSLWAYIAVCSQIHCNPSSSTWVLNVWWPSLTRAILKRLRDERLTIMRYTNLRLTRLQNPGSATEQRRPSVQLKRSRVNTPPVTYSSVLASIVSARCCPIHGRISIQSARRTRMLTIRFGNGCAVDRGITKSKGSIDPHFFETGQGHGVLFDPTFRLLVKMHRNARFCFQSFIHFLGVIRQNPK